MNPSTIARLNQLFPPLAQKGYALIRQLAAQGIDVEVSQGLRTWPEQEALYAKGRTTPGPIVTMASPDKSWHTFGCAFDVDIVTAGGLDWSGNSPAWKLTIDCGQSLALVAGAEFRTFPDKPHFQLTGRFPVTPDDEVLILFRGGGLQAVWDEISKSLPSQQ
jgi:peptidoglycan L-alanyl-D-glutamate endopeptidase CwlK